MKLKKREITLNEMDSLLDVLYLEETIAGAYGEGAAASCRRETQNEAEGLQKEALSDVLLIKGLWKKSVKEGL